MNGLQMTSDAYFGSLTLAATELAELEKTGKPLPPKFDFGVVPACFYCGKNLSPPLKATRCSACKAVIYCGKECSKAGWNTPKVPNAPVHKVLCPDNARHMKRIDECHAILKQFSWGRMETDGTFNRDIAKGRYKVLGGDDYGFWSHKGGPVPHQDAGPWGPKSGQGDYGDLIRMMYKGFEHLDGKDLLKNKHLTDVQGWKLPTDHIPYREFPSDSKRPVNINDFVGGVKDWDSWYRWRKLPKDSIAALIMNFPLTVYQLVVNCLEVTESRRGSEGKRIPILIHMLGVEVELNYVPIFAELALLLPYHDIKLTMFGYSVHKLMEEAKSKHPNSLAGKSTSTTPVFSYKAPPECGSGSLDVYLYGESSIWTPDLSTSLYGKTPDALIACNAGLNSYPEWFPVIQACHIREIPFAVTDYGEQSVEQQIKSFPMILQGRNLMKEYPYGLNPFHSPGQRGVPSIRLPFLSNGFTLVVFKK